MDLYISKNCPHCHQLLKLFKENKHLIPYFNIMDIETNSYPQSITSVPTLIKDNQLYSGDKLNNIINDVNRFDMEQRGQGQMPEAQNQPDSHAHQPDERDIQMQQFSQQTQSQPKQAQPKQSSDDDISGVCLGEECMYESIDNSNSNNLMGDYCFLDDGYSESKPKEQNNQGDGDKSGRFDNSAYEAMMKSRGM